MGALALLAGLGLLALFASQSGGDSGGTTAVQSDLQKLYAKSPDAGNAVQAMLVAASDPSTIAQYAAQLAGDYPALSQALVQRFNQAVTPVTGASGTAWNTWKEGQDPNTKLTTVHVLAGATPVLTYTFSGDTDTTLSRHFAASTPGADSATVARARADFSL